VSGRPRWDPADYAAHSAVQEAWGRELAIRLGLRGAERILDVGCGDGRLTAWLAGLVPQGCVLGVDAAPEMIAHARRAFPESRHPRLRFEVCAAEQIGSLGLFDVVFCNATLHWIEEPANFFRAAAECLRPGGRLAVFGNARGNAAEVMEAVLRVVRRRPWRTWFRNLPRAWRLCRLEEYGAWLEAAGFGVVRLAEVDRCERFAGVEAFAGWIRTTWLPYTQRVPEGWRAGFVAAVVEDYLARRPVEPDGSVTVGMRRLELEAVRVRA